MEKEEIHEVQKKYLFLGSSPDDYRSYTLRSRDRRINKEGFCDSRNLPPQNPLD
jgi:hypothetical protein